MVIFVHLSGILSLAGSAYDLGEIGHAGVDLFFVISGFIMVYTTHHGRAGPAAFFLRRVERIVPMYWLVTLMVFSLVTVAPSIFKHTTANFEQLLQSLFFIPFDKGGGTFLPVLFVGWSLNFEMFFYAILAAAMFTRRMTVAYGLTIVAILGLCALRAILPPSGLVAAFYTSNIMLEFAFGMVAALAFLRAPTSPRHPGLVIAALLTAVAVLLIWPVSDVASAERGMFNGPRMLHAGLPSLFVVGLAATLDKWGLSVRNRMVLAVGDASYSIYLTHMFVTQLMEKIAGKAGVSGLAMPIVLALISLIVACAGGIAIHRVIERPLSRWIGSILRPGRRVPA